jgi:lipid A ethanolaminephosphotransferase
MVINLTVAAFLLFCANGPFWHNFVTGLGLETVGHRGFLLAVGLSLFMAFNLLFSFFSFRPVYKPFLIIVLLTAATVNYFMSSYGIVIDRQMITSLLETDVGEASEHLTWPLFKHFFILGVFPSAALLLTRVSYLPWRRELLVRIGAIMVSGALLASMLVADFKNFALFGREHSELRMYINPTYPIYSLIKVLHTNQQSKRNEPLRVVAADARRPDIGPKTVVVMVVGETARAQNFSLNGYHRNTNPELSARDIFNFTEVQSCGTDTAESLPCMFSHLGKAQFGRTEAKRYENLLDVLQRTGVRVVWRDNNSGSKGISDRVATELLNNEKDEAFCSAGECYDEILLKNLGELINRNSGDMLIVLHQNGSHGPSYYKRHPKNFKVFTPECTQDNIQDCDPRSIINAYDNTILYTDYFLAKLIDLLKTQSFSTAMLYVSDHGESLGENSIYLHGLPGFIAPDQQSHVPMVFWASGKFMLDKNIDPSLLKKRERDRLSHYNLFHSILGLFGIKSNLYRSHLDLFHTS